MAAGGGRVAIADEFETHAPRYTRLYIGHVVDRADPEQLGSGQVRISELIESASTWAFALGTVGGGSDRRGFFAVPEAGAEVGVLFPPAEDLLLDQALRALADQRVEILLCLLETMGAMLFAIATLTCASNASASEAALKRTRVNAGSMTGTRVTLILIWPVASATAAGVAWSLVVRTAMLSSPQGRISKSAELATVG